MSGIIDMITGASARKAQRMQADAIQSSQNTAIANLANQSAKEDQAASAATGPRGRRLLTHIGAAGAGSVA